MRKMGEVFGILLHFNENLGILVYDFDYSFLLFHKALWCSTTRCETLRKTDFLLPQTWVISGYRILFKRIYRDILLNKISFFQGILSELKECDPSLLFQLVLPNDNDQF